MVVSGLPVRNGNNHIREISNMALDIRHKVVDFKFRHLTDRKLEIRIGLHSGINYVYMKGILLLYQDIFL